MKNHTPPKNKSAAEEKLIQIKEADLENLKKCRETGLQLNKKVEQLENGLREWHERALRVAAELENYKKRSEKEKEEIRKLSCGSMIREFLAFDEIFEKAVSGISENVGDVKNFVTGMQMLKKEFSNFLASFGVQKIATVGKPFDPHLHEAVAVEKTPDSPEGIIIAEIRSGYAWEGKLLKPAQVKVSGGKNDSSVACKT